MRNDLDARDPMLTGLFSSEEQPLSDTDFLRQVMLRVEAGHRRRRAISVLSVVALLVLGVFGASRIMVGVSALGAFLTAGTLDILLQPLTLGILGGAVLFALLPVAYVWWSWRR